MFVKPLHSSHILVRMKFSPARPSNPDVWSIWEETNVDMLGLRYIPVNLNVERSPVSQIGETAQTDRD